MCRNIISQVGFGRGKLKIVGSKRMTKQFVVPPPGGGSKVFVFKGADVAKVLDFSWFLYHVVCPAKMAYVLKCNRLLEPAKKTRFDLLESQEDYCSTSKFCRKIE